MNPANSFTTGSGIRISGGVKRPILYCAVSFSIGISISYFFRIPVIHFVIACLILITLSALFFKRNTLSHIFLYLALILFGAVYYQSYNTLPENHIARFISDEGKKVFIKGIVADDPVRKMTVYGKEKISFVLHAQALGLLRPAFGGTRNDGDDGGTRNDGDYDWQKVAGLVKVDVYSDEGKNRINFGDEIAVKGALSRPKGLKNPGLFNYADYLKIKNIYAALTVNGIYSVNIIGSGRSGRIQLWAYSLRRSVNEAITRYVDERSGGFLKAILVGERSSLEAAVTDDFIKTGTVHVIAISGLNIALIAGIFFFVFKTLGLRKKFNLLLTSALLIFYCFVAGASPPVARATIMFVIACLGYIIDRESDILNSLAIAAFFILLGNPKELFDPGFQLSFASIFGIVSFSPRIEAIFSPGPGYLIKGVAVSIAAIIAVAPIVGKYFNIVSPIAVIANLVIVPALFIMTIASFIFLLLYFLHFNFILVYAGYALSFLTKATFYINHLFAGIGLSYIRISAPSLAFLLLYYVFIFSFLFLRRKNILWIALLLFINIYVWGRAIAPNNNKDLKITFLDVGKGDSILLEFPDGATALIDAGSGGIEGLFDTGRAVVAPYLWNKDIRRIDVVITTHFHSDHMGGLLYILQNFDVGCVMDSSIAPESEKYLYEKYRRIVSHRNLRRLTLAEGDEITGFGNAKVFVINPPEGRAYSDTNDSSVVIKIEYKNFSALLCGDISGHAMEGILGYGNFLKSDVLKIPHHGSVAGKEEVAKRFFRIVSPDVSMVSSGRHSLCKGMSEEKFYFSGVNYDTYKNGAIIIFTDGYKFIVRPFYPRN